MDAEVGDLPGSSSGFNVITKKETGVSDRVKYEDATLMVRRTEEPEQFGLHKP